MILAEPINLKASEGTQAQNIMAWDEFWAQLVAARQEGATNIKTQKYLQLHTMSP